MRTSEGYSRSPQEERRRNRLRRHRLRKDNAAPEDGDGTWPRKKRPAHRMHPAAPPRRRHGRRASSGGIEVTRRRHHRLPAPLREKSLRLDARQVHDRRRPSRGNSLRPTSSRLRHDHCRRGARAFAQRRLPARDSQAHLGKATRPQSNCLVCDIGHRAFLAVLRRCTDAFRPWATLPDRDTIPRTTRRRRSRSPARNLRRDTDVTAK